MKTYQNTDRRRIQALKIDKTSDYGGILVDPDGFAPARVEVHGHGGRTWMNVPRGGYILFEYGIPRGVLSEEEFHRHWEPPEMLIPATMRLLESLRPLAEKNYDDEDVVVCMVYDGPGSGFEITISVGDVRNALAENGRPI